MPGNFEFKILSLLNIINQAKTYLKINYVRFSFVPSKSINIIMSCLRTGKMPEFYSILTFNQTWKPMKYLNSGLKYYFKKIYRRWNYDTQKALVSLGKLHINANKNKTIQQLDQ